jgi:amino acid transporter
MLITVALVSLSYVLPVMALQRAGFPSDGLSAGAWVEAARAVGGRWLSMFVTIGGLVAAAGTFNSLMMSYSRLPVALAEDGLLPKVLAKHHPKTNAPWVAIMSCAIAFALVMPLGFERLVALDVLLYGLSLVLEFVALVVLRFRSPEVPRPFRVPGGKLGAILVGVPPTLLIGAAAVQSAGERIGPLSASSLGAIIVAAAPLVYLIARRSGASTKPPAAGG